MTTSEGNGIAGAAPDLGRIGVIVNPVAGNGRALRLLPWVVAALGTTEDVRAVHVTRAPGEAAAVAADFVARGLPLVVAVDGDGTVNEVVNGLLSAADTGVVLEIVSAGRGANFARSVGLPRDPIAALFRHRTGVPRVVDVGRAVFADGSSRVFANVAGVGSDAEVAARAARSRVPGATGPYLAGLVGALRSARPRRVEVATDGALLCCDALAVVVANGHSFGGELRIASDAKVNDGWVDVTIVGDVSRLELLQQIPVVYGGTHARHPKFTVLRARSVRVDGDGPMPVQLDGEPVGSAPVSFAVEPAALRILV